MNNIRIIVDLLQGDISRLRIAEVEDRPLLGFAVPRADLQALLERHELGEIGLYVLWGNGHARLPKAYVGKGQIRKRMRDHMDMEFWENAIVFSSRDGRLTASHYLFLEGKLLDEAHKAGGFELENDNKSGEDLPAHDQKRCCDYLFWIRQLLRVLGCNLLVPGGGVPCIDRSTHFQFDDVGGNEEAKRQQGLGAFF